MFRLFVMTKRTFVWFADKNPGKISARKLSGGPTPLFFWRSLYTLLEDLLFFSPTFFPICRRPARSPPGALLDTVTKITAWLPSRDLKWEILGRCGERWRGGGSSRCPVPKRRRKKKTCTFWILWYLRKRGTCVCVPCVVPLESLRLCVSLFPLPSLSWEGFVNQ